jgi:hypothetical protein
VDLDVGTEEFDQWFARLVEDVVIAPQRFDVLR